MRREHIIQSKMKAERCTYRIQSMKIIRNRAPPTMTLTTDHDYTSIYPSSERRRLSGAHTHTDSPGPELFDTVPLLCILTASLFLLSLLPSLLHRIEGPSVVCRGEPRRRRCPKIVRDGCVPTAALRQH